uniref:Uncharacterized protein n=1 Tax=blood disease bacterium R229 TaxID=741978 RepID=G2ZNL1_9RALS|nr:conserved hypothetical protein [blood disease bacterium R229]
MVPECEAGYRTMWLGHRARLPHANAQSKIPRMMVENLRPTYMLQSMISKSFTIMQRISFGLIR